MSNTPALSLSRLQSAAACLTALENIVIDIFDAQPLSQQPEAIAHLEGGDGSVLHFIYQTVLTKTLRGRHLKSQPLTLILLNRQQFSCGSLLELGGYCMQATAEDCQRKIAELAEENVDRGKILYLNSLAEINVADVEQESQHLADLVGRHGIVHLAVTDTDDEQQAYDQLLLAAAGRALFPKENCLTSVDVEPEFVTSGATLSGDIVEAGLKFGSEPIGDLDHHPYAASVQRLTVVWLELRDYTARLPMAADMPDLLALETACWPQALAMSEHTLASRIYNNPRGQLLLEQEGLTLGVIYTQRIADVEQIYAETGHSVDSLHRQDGSIGQLLAVNVRPDMQHRRLGDQLLEFMLQRCSILPGLESIVGVTRAKDYDKYSSLAYDEYIRLRNPQGRLMDTVLRFHELHGASIERVIEGYRPDDLLNQGCGVLVCYQPEERQAAVEKAKKLAQPIAAIDPQTAWSPAAVAETIRQSVCGLLSDHRADFDLQRPLMEMGLDSGDLLDLSETLCRKFTLQLSASFFFQYNNCEKIITVIQAQLADRQLLLASSVADELPQSFETSAAKATGTDTDTRQRDNIAADSTSRDIAIIGMACKLPGGIEDADQLWQFLCEGGDAIGECDSPRWDWPAGIDPEGEHPGIDQGGFIDDIASFDAGFFRISPREALLMDPQQRLMLELSWACLEDAGYPPSTLAGSRTGVYIGASGTDYQLLANERLSHVDAHAGLATSMAILPNRLSYFYDFTGPSVQVDTACSSSLVAVHKAIEALRIGRCQQALVGGVHLMCHPANTIAYYKAGMLAPDARCKTFDASANGYVRSEGAVLLLLKPLVQAQEQGDRIYAVLKGGAVNHGGQAGGLTVPHPGRQAELVKAAHDDAGVCASAISYVEAHGTGTSLGDPIELSGLKIAFAEGQTNRCESQTCGVGSIKTNMGHLEAASGITGLLKVVMSLRHRQLPASIHFDSLNSKIDLTATPFRIISRHQGWSLGEPGTTEGQAEKVGVRRLAGVSSFGSGGSNAHVIVEEYSGPVSELADRSVVVLLSAKNSHQLRQSIERLLMRLSASKAPLNLMSLAFTLQCGRESMDSRFACVVESRAHLLTCLQQFLAVNNNVTAQSDSRDFIYQPSLKHYRASQPSSNVASDVASNELLNGQLDAEQLQHLAISWSRGVDVDWARLWPQAPALISLPSYPFSRESYWLPAVESASGDASVTQHRSLHPLLHRNTSSLLQQRFSSSFDGSEFFLRDHQVDGRGVLPGVAYIELARAAVSQALEMSAEQALTLEFHHLVFARPLVFSGEPLALDITLQPMDSGVIEFEVYSLPVDPLKEEGSSDEQPTAELANQPTKQLHAQGTVSFRSELQAYSGSMATEIVVPDLQREFTQPVAVAHYYRALAEVGLDYGPAHQPLVQLSLTAAVDRAHQRLLAHWQQPQALADSAGEGLDVYGLHPSLMDAALQAVYGFVYDDQAGIAELALPFALDKLTQWRALTERGLILVQPASTGGQLQKLDIALYNPEGQLCVAIEGYVTRVVKAPSKPVAWDSLLLSPQWLTVEPSTAESDQVKGEPVFACHWLILAEQNEALLSQLQLEFPEARCLQLSVVAGTANIEQSYTEAAAQLLAYCQAILANKIPGRQRIQLLLPDTASAELLRGLAGLLKTLQWETPQISCQLLQLDEFYNADSYTILNTQITRALHSADSDLRYRQGQCQRLQLCEQPVNLTPAADTVDSPWREGGTYLFTGGAGALGLRFAEHILTSVRAIKIILLGRSPLQGSRRQAFERLLKKAGQQGSLLDYRMTDVVGRTSMTETVAEWVADHGPLTGVIHAAGVLQDSLLMFKQEAELRRVLAPKVAGLVALDEATKDQPLELFISFASTSGVFGNVGQADYAAANAFMDAFIEQRSRRVIAGERSGQCLSMAWPLWADGGMQVDEAAEQRFYQSMGIKPLSTALGLQALDAALGLTVAQLTLLSGSREKMVEHLQLTAVAAGSDAASDEPRLPVAELESAPLDAQQMPSPQLDQELREQALDYFTRLFGKQISMPASRIDATEALENYGIDSILVTQLTNALEKIFGPLSKTLFFEYQTLAQLCDYFIDAHRPLLLTQLGAEVAVTHSPTDNNQSLPASLQPDTAEYVEPAHTDSTSHLSTKERYLSKFNHRFVQSQQASESGTQRSNKGPLNIAIVGISGRYPQSPTLDAYWQNLSQGVDCVSEIPLERWDASRYFDREKGKSGKSHSKWGGFIEGVDQFDPLFFNITPHEAELIDPQERLFLQCAYHTLEDAGYTRELLARKYPAALDGNAGANVGVFVGVMYAEYQLYAAQAQALGQDYGLLENVSSIANRVSHFCNFNGPSMAVDTMCSSSLTAIHLACESIVSGDCDAALAGGVNVSVHPNKYLALSQGMFVSSNGRCMSFGEGGDGYVPGEGIGAVLLKPLAMALTDNDHVYGVIKSVAINHGGKTNGYTVPNPNAQAAVIAKSLQKSAIDPRTISYIEAHGTGTSLGDPIEIAGLSKAFGGQASEKQFCAIGSAKSNIGHCESAAGIAGLSKVLLQMQHQTLVPSLHSQTLNPNIDFQQTPFVVQRQLTPWSRPVVALDNQPAREYPRIAGLSSFGAGGANAHLIVEEFLAPEVSQTASFNKHNQALVVLSARNEQQLQQQQQQLRDYLNEKLEQSADTRLEQQPAGIDLFSLAYTLQVGREAMECRWACRVSSLEELSELLDDCLQGLEQREFFRGEVKRNKDTLAVFSADDDLQQAISAWIAKGKFGKLLALWVKGLVVDWQALYSELEPPVRMSLPVYPFARQRCWVPELNISSAQASTAVAFLHPLLQRNSSSLIEQRFSSRFDGSEFFFKDHRVLQQKILPAAAYLELARAAVEQALELTPESGAVIHLAEVFFEQPLVVAEDVVELHIALYQPSAASIAFEVFTRADTEDIIHTRGTAWLAPEDEAQALRQAGVLNLPALQAQCSQVLSHAACYGAFHKMGLHYGPAHKALEKVSLGVSASGQRLAVGELRLPESLTAGSEDYVLHPSILDAALQACLCLVLDPSSQSPSQPLLPFAVERLDVLSATAPLSRVVVEAASDTEAKVQVFNIVITDNTGAVAVRLQGFSTRALAVDSIVNSATVVAESSATEVVPVGELTLVPSWNPFIPASAQRWPLADERVLILADDADGAKRLKGFYPDAEVAALTSAESASQASELIARLLDGVIDGNTDSTASDNLVRGEKFDHIFWLLPTADIDLTSQAMIDAQQVGVLNGFRLVKALLARGYDETSLGLTVISQNTLAVSSGETSHPAHASLHGLLGALLKEYPQWTLRSIDLPATEPWPLAQILAMPSRSDAREVAYRQGQWYQQRLLPCELAAGEQAVYRKNGVYLLLGGAGGLGEVFSEYLIKHYQAQVIWIGRRPQSDEISAKCQRLAEFGPQPRYLSADASNLLELQAAYDTVRAEFGAIHGLVNTVLVLQDQGLAGMDEQTFASSLAAKVDVSVNAAQVFGQEPLDFVLFFSSLQSFYRPSGQSNYAAGCAFTDAYARALDQSWQCDVKVVNWGFWGSVGIVASDSYRQRMADFGLGSVEPPEGLALLDKLLQSPLQQVIYLQTTKPRVAEDLLVDNRAHIRVLERSDRAAANLTTTDLASAATEINSDSVSLIDDAKPPVAASVFPLAIDTVSDSIRLFDEFLAKILYSQLRELGLFQQSPLDIDHWQQQVGFPKQYQTWLNESLRVLEKHQYLVRVASADGQGEWRDTAVELPVLDSLWQQWHEFKANVALAEDTQQQPILEAQLGLVDATIKALPQILQGKLPATEVIFPDSSMRLVEGVYKYNLISDYFNGVLADSLIAAIEQQLLEQPGKQLRLLEIGAGTGGTSALLFERLQPYRDRIEAYSYTDISNAFLLHGRENFTESAPYLQTHLFNVSEPLADQGLEPGSYDFVLATNVLHATPDICRTLRNAKALLKDSGLLLINELSQNTLFLHLTFGLLDGWWLSEDLPLRTVGSPVLNSEQWRWALDYEGFAEVSYPAAATHELGQQIIVARSNGVVCQQSVLLSEHQTHQQFELPSVNSERKLEVGRPEEKQSLAGASNGQLLSSSQGALITTAQPIATVGASTNSPLDNKVAGEAQLQDKLTENIRQLIASTLKMPVAELDVGEAFESYGVDSILVVRVTNALRDAFGDISSTLLFEYSSIDELTQHFLSERFEQMAELLGFADPQQITAAPGVSDPAFNGEVASAASSVIAPLSTVATQALPAGLNIDSGRRAARAAGRRGGSLAVIESSQPAQTQPSIQDPVAIIGLSGRYPRAKNVDEFWLRLRNGDNCIGEIPRSRWQWKDYFASKQSQSNDTVATAGIYSKWGGFIDDVDAFDSLFFSISPREAANMDPQERLFLETAQSTLDDAGYQAQDLADNQRVGVFVGVMNNTYRSQPSHWSIANRVSYFFDFSGPSLALDTACSSSLTAIHMACESINSGKCGAAIAGGVNLIIDAAHYQGLTDLTMLSEGDKCRSFGAGADGFVDAEGVGAVLLKPLSQAVAEGAHIYAVIRGGAINHGGRTNGYTVPNPKAQAAVIAEALEAAAVHPRALSYIEAHGTGTSLGDPIEIAGLSKAFSIQTQERQYCAIGSAKSNIGHCESAAGIAALTKVLLQLKHQQLVPSLHSEELNPNIDFATTPFVVQQQLAPWPRPTFLADGESVDVDALQQQTQQPRRIAGISSFGAGGANAHLIVEEYQTTLSTQSLESLTPEQPVLIVLSAKSQERLRQYATLLLAHVESQKAALGELAFTLQVGRNPLEIRLAFSVTSMEELQQKLQSFLASSADSAALDSSAEFYWGDIRQHKDSLALLTSDEDFDQTLLNWMHKGKYAKLLSLWCKGLKVEWRGLYRGDVPKRISLPGYPFEPKRYWQSNDSHRINLPPAASNIAIDASAVASVAMVPVLHPLVHRNSSDLEEQKFTSTFVGDEFFLTDHVIDGRQMLPSAVYLEMARAAVFESLGSVKQLEYPELTLSHIVFIQPLVVADSAVDVDIVLTPLDQQTVVFEIYTRRQGEERVHIKGRANLLSEVASAVSVDLSLLTSYCPQFVNAETVYQAFSQLGLAFGPSHRAIQQLHLGRDAQGHALSIAQIRLPEHLESQANQYLLHPSLLDGALQASIGLMLEDFDGSHKSQPFALDNVQIFSACPMQFTTVVRSDSMDGGGQLQKVNVDIVDDSGRLCVRFTGFSSRLLLNDKSTVNNDLAVKAQPKVNANQVNKALDQVETAGNTFASASSVDSLTGDLTLTPMWRAYQPQWCQSWPLLSESVLFIGEQLTQQEQSLLQFLQAYFPQLKHLCLSDCGQNMTVAASELQVDIQQSIEGLGQFDHIFWLVPAADQEAFNANGIVVEQSRGVLAGYALSKALLALGYGDGDLGLSILTQQARPLHYHDHSHPAHASVHGFIGSLAKEFPKWKIRLLDLPEAGEWPLQQLLELPADEKGNLKIYRHGSWYRQELLPVELAADDATLLRRAGVYLVLGGAGGAGSSISEYLLKRYGAKVIWLGRRPLDDAIRAKCEALQAFGPRPLYLSVDATDRQALAEAAAKVEKEFGPVNGIIHSALVMSGAALVDMDEQRFNAGLHAKLHTSVYVDEAFGHDQLDFTLLFSSIQAFEVTPKQSNYSAGTTFTDAYALALGQRLSSAVKVINWGYLAGTEFVSMKSFQGWMDEEGMGAVDIIEAMPEVEKFLASSLRQMVYHRVTKPKALRALDIDTHQCLRILPSTREKQVGTLAGLLPIRTNLLFPVEHDNYQRDLEQFNVLLADLLYQQLAQLGLFELIENSADTAVENARVNLSNKLAVDSWTTSVGLPDMLQGWLQESLQILAAAGYLSRDHDQWWLQQPMTDTAEQLAQRWSSFKQQAIDNVELRAQIRLADIMLPKLAEVLRGEKPATQIMFPGSSLKLVEGIYKQHRVADYFNDVVAESLIVAIEARLAQDPTAKFRLLEIGAGTGGTSQLLFERLSAYRDHIDEYCYTDISKAFLQHAEDHYRDLAPYLKTRLLNVEAPQLDESLCGSYDFVVATNVLHATKDIRHTLVNAHALLKQHGLLLLNELVENSRFLHLTFGLLEGWWLSTDSQLRITGSPILTSQTWAQVLEEQGFELLAQPAQQARSLGQQIFVAQSCGRILLPRQQQASSRPVLAAAEAPSSSPVAITVESAPQPLESKPQTVAGKAASAVDVYQVIVEHLAQGLNLEREQIHPQQSFADYGVDSVTGIRLVEGLNAALAIELSPTSIFDFSSVQKLRDHIIADYPQLAAEGTESVTPMAVSPVMTTAAVNSAPVPSGVAPSGVVVSKTEVSDSLISHGGAFETAATESEREVVYQTIARHLCQGLGLQLSQLNPTDSFADYGVDSVTGIRLVEAINADLDIELSPTSIFDYSSLRRLTDHILQQYPALMVAGKSSGLLEADSAEPSQATAVVDALRATAESSASATSTVPVAVPTKVAATGKVDLDHRVVEVIKDSLCTGLNLQVEQINAVDSFADYGVDSVTGIRLVEAINDQLNIDLSPTSLFDYSSLEKLSRHIIEAYSDQLSAELSAQVAVESAPVFVPPPRVVLASGADSSIPSPVAKRRSAGRKAKSYLESHSTAGKQAEVAPIAGTAEARTTHTRRAQTTTAQASPVFQGDDLSREPIAVIGMSGRYASADSIDQLWQQLAAGNDLVEEVSRWDLSVYQAEDNSNFCSRGGLLENIDCFDSLFFNISGVEAAYIDPQQRLFLEESWHALEDAGYAGVSIEGRRCGVYAGCNGSDYGDLIIGRDAPAQALWGNAASLLSARIAYYLDLHGPAISVDTACSSSLSAIHMACQGLRAGEAELALAGGAFVQATDKFYVMANRAEMLSADGRCHTFDARANGFVPGEGVGVLVLKRLSAALADGDHIHGLVRASGTNQDGTTNGITAPSALSQQRLICDIYDKFGINPADIQLVEAHGTGTKLGDPIEFQALTKAFKQLANERGESLPQGSCALGSIKTNIGHTTAASGVAGAIKLLMCFKHRQMPPSLHYQQGNPHINFDQSPLYVNRHLQEWRVADGVERCAAISSFGLSGTNVHAVLSEAPVQALRSVKRDAYLVVLSAQTQTILQRQVEQLLTHCRSHQPDCGNLSFTLLLGRRYLAKRLALVVTDTDDLISQLQAWLSVNEADPVAEASQGLTEISALEALLISCRKAQGDALVAGLQQLAQAFEAGQSLNYQALFSEQNYARIPLPTYPFAKQRHWVPESNARLQVPLSAEHNSVDFSSAGPRLKPSDNTLPQMSAAQAPLARDDYDKIFDQLMDDSISIDDALNAIS